MYVSLSPPSCPRGPFEGWVALPFLFVPLHWDGGFPRRPRFFFRTCRRAAGLPRGRHGTGLTPLLQNPPLTPPGGLPLLAGVLPGNIK